MRLFKPMLLARLHLLAVIHLGKLSCSGLKGCCTVLQRLEGRVLCRRTQAGSRLPMDALSRRVSWFSRYSVTSGLV